MLTKCNTIVFVSDQIIANTYQSADTICAGDIVSIGVNTSGSMGSYSFNWDNGLSSSFQHLVAPIFSTDYIVQVFDGCSDAVIDSIQIIVQPTFSNSFITSSKKCYGEMGFAKFW